MDCRNPSVRDLLIVSLTVFACAASGCHNNSETIDENQLALYRQSMEIDAAKLPVPVPSGAREIPAGHFGFISELMISPNRTRLFVMGSDPMDASDLPRSSAFVVDLNEAKVLSKYDLHPYRSAFSPDERRLAAIGHVALPVEADSSSIEKGQPASLLQQLVRDKRSWKWTYDMRVSDVASGKWQTIVGSSPLKIDAICWHQDGRQVITAALNRPIPTKAESLVGEPQIEFSFWNGETGALLQQVIGPKLNYDSATFSNGGRLVALWNSTAPDAIVICNPSNGDILHRLSRHDQPLQELAFSPSGRYLASRELLKEAADTKIVVWDLETGDRICELPCSAARMAFSLDGQQLATANIAINDAQEIVWSVSLWDAMQGKELKSLTPGGENVRVAFLSNTELLTSSTFARSGSLVSRVFVWDVAQ